MVHNSWHFSSIENGLWLLLSCIDQIYSMACYLQCEYPSKIFTVFSIWVPCPVMWKVYITSRFKIFSIRSLFVFVFPIYEWRVFSICLVKTALHSEVLVSLSVQSGLNISFLNFISSLVIGIRTCIFFCLGRRWLFKLCIIWDL